jgi:hypothetical protein
MEFQLDQATEVLQRTPAVLDALLRGKSEAWLNCRIGPGTFSPVDVLGHLISGEMTDWMPRAEIILKCGEGRAFDPFDRFGFAPLLHGRSVDELLTQFAELRAKSLAALEALRLDDRALDLTGMHPDPALGRVTMKNLLATWVVHDLGHIAQIMRIMSSEYREEVGPWRQYLTIIPET